MNQSPEAGRPGRARDSALAADLPLWRRYGRFAGDVFRESSRDDLPTLAAALAHYILLSLIPVLLVAASIFGVYLNDDVARRQAVDLIEQWLPADLADETVGPQRPAAYEEAIVGVFNRIVRDRGTVGGVGLLVLLWICLRIFTTLQRALDHIWHIDHTDTRPFYIQYPLALLTIFVLGLFAWLSMVATSLVNSLRFDWPRQLLGDAFHLPDWATVSSVLVSLGLSVTLMFLIFRWLPSARVRSRSALYGAVVAGLLWEGSKHLFAWFITYRATYTEFYGAMGGLVVVMLWSYLSSYILLVGAEVTYCHAKWIAHLPILAATPGEADGT